MADKQSTSYKSIEILRGCCIQDEFPEIQRLFLRAGGEEMWKPGEGISGEDTEKRRREQKQKKRNLWYFPGKYGIIEKRSPT